jgi:signal transduction histidine kinase
MRQINNKKVLILISIGTISITYILLLSFGLENETAIVQSLVNQQRQRQEQAVKNIASNIASELNSILGRVEDLAILKSSIYDDSRAARPETSTMGQTNLEDLYEELFNRTYFDSNNTIDRLFEVNSDGIITMSLFPQGEESFYGANMSFREYFKESSNSKVPSYSSMFKGLDGISRIVITYPILSSDITGNGGSPMDALSKSNGSATVNNSGEGRYYLGLVGASMPVKLFEKYGNTNSIQRQYMVMLDNNGTIMLTPRVGFIGKPFFGTDFQKFIEGDKVYNELVRTVMLSGKPASGTYNIKEQGEYLNTGFPVFLMNNNVGQRGNSSDNIAQRPQYSVFVITPFRDMLSSLDELVSRGRIQTLALLSVLTAAVSIVSILFYRWNRDLAKEVQQKTIHLSNANNILQDVNRRLVADEKSKEEFISMVSHELRTPLTPIMAFAEMLLKPKYMNQAVLNEKQTKAVNSIVQNIRVLEKLVADVLDVYRIEMGRLKISKRSYDVSELVNRTLSNFKPTTDEKNIIFNSDIQTARGTKVYCDPERVGQVFGNLVKNSIDFVPKGGRITIRAEELSGPKLEAGNTTNSSISTRMVENEDEQIRATAAANTSTIQEPRSTTSATDEEKRSRLSVLKKPSSWVVNTSQESDNISQKHTQYALFTVEDNGIGIPKDKIDHLFQKFYQIDTSLTRKHGGTGLGLAICKGIIEAHGGIIWIDKGYSQGAAIKFTLPEADDTSKRISSTADDHTTEDVGSSDRLGGKRE